MKTSATNRKIGRLMNEIRAGQLVPQPGFQRRLVWANKHKSAFIQTVLKELPFPEIYIAVGDLDTETGQSKELLVDGQQRMTTLYQYFTNSPDLKLAKDITPYSELQEDQKRQFLEYEVVIRDLGSVGIDRIKEVFERINSTRYSLTAMEIHHARFEGEFKQIGEELAKNEFFDRHRVFSANDVRRMEDVKYCLVIVITVMDTYMNRDDELEEYLKRYNDEFPGRERLASRLQSTLSIIDKAGFAEESRIWKKADFFTAVVEIDRAREAGHQLPSPEDLRQIFEAFYQKVDYAAASSQSDVDATSYYFAAIQASNDRQNRIIRGEIVARLLQRKSDLQRRLFDDQR